MWITNPWNWIDIASYVLFGTGVVLRHNEDTLAAARVLQACSLFVFYLKLLNLFVISKGIGPKVIMIAKMVCYFLDKIKL